MSLKEIEEITNGWKEQAFPPCESSTHTRIPLERIAKEQEESTYRQLIEDLAKIWFGNKTKE